MEVAFPTEVMTPVRFAFVVTFPAVNPAAVPVMFVPTSAEGVPRAGVTNVGLVFITNVDPVPVWLATEVALPVDVIGPVRLALVVTVPAVSPLAVPVTLVITPEAGVPRAGVTKVKLVAANPLGRVVEIEGTPPADVTNTPLFPVANPATVVPVEA